MYRTWLLATGLGMIVTTSAWAQGRGAAALPAGFEEKLTRAMTAAFGKYFTMPSKGTFDQGTNTVTWVARANFDGSAPIAPGVRLPTPQASAVEMLALTGTVRYLDGDGVPLGGVLEGAFVAKLRTSPLPNQLRRGDPCRITLTLPKFDLRKAARIDVRE